MQLKEPSTHSLMPRILPILFFGLFSSLYLLHHHFELKYGYAVGQSICNINEYFNCDAVAKSAYSEFLGIPVALFGSAFFASLLLACFIFRNRKQEFRNLLIFLLFLALPVIFYFLTASLFVVKKLCVFCTLVYLVIFILFILVFVLGRSDGSFWSRIKSGFRLSLAFTHFPARNWMISSLGLFVFLISSSSLYVDYVLRPRYFAILDKEIISDLIKEWDESEVAFSYEEAKNLAGVISLGSNDAKVQLVEFSDFQCPFCQKVAPIIENVFNDYKNDINLVLINYPLDNACNKKLDRVLHEFSCELSKITIAQTQISAEEGYRTHALIMERQVDSRSEVDEILEEVKISPQSLEKLEASLQSQLEFGTKSNVYGTPSLFIQGKKVAYNNIFQLEKVLREILDKSLREE